MSEEAAVQEAAVPSQDELDEIGEAQKARVGGAQVQVEEREAVAEEFDDELPSPPVSPDPEPQAPGDNVGGSVLDRLRNRSDG